MFRGVVDGCDGLTFRLRRGVVYFGSAVFFYFVEKVEAVGRKLKIRADEEEVSVL